MLTLLGIGCDLKYSCIVPSRRREQKFYSEIHRNIFTSVLTEVPMRKIYQVKSITSIFSGVGFASNRYFELILLSNAATCKHEDRIGFKNTYLEHTHIIYTGFNLNTGNKGHNHQDTNHNIL